MLSENELDAFLGFSDPSEVAQILVYASLLWTTRNVLSMSLEQSTDSCIKYAILHQGNARVAIVHRCCDGVFQYNDSFWYHLLWNHVNTSEKLCDNFRNGGLPKISHGAWNKSKKRDSKSEKNMRFFILYFEKNRKKIRKRLFGQKRGVVIEA